MVIILLGSCCGTRDPLPSTPLVLWIGLDCNGGLDSQHVPAHWAVKCRRVQGLVGSSRNFQVSERKGQGTACESK